MLHRISLRISFKEKIIAELMRKKSQDATEKLAITKRICGLAQEHLAMGLSTSTKVICHNCGNAKSIVGSVRYGRYRLCNDCALQYELTKAEGNVQTIEDFVLVD
jgi:hypothetical protein